MLSGFPPLAGPLKLLAALRLNGMLEWARLLLMPAPSIHTFFMRFPIDAVFLDGDKRVLKVAPDLPPWRAAAAKNSRAVLELAAGEAARVGLVAGDVLRLEVSS